MKTICFYFQVHQPFRIRRYRFFDIGNDHYYWDEYMNRSVMRKVAEKCYLPANQMLLSLIKEWGCRFKVSFSLTGTVIEQFEKYAPDVLKSFQELAETGCVEFLGETYAHSLSALSNKEEFVRQVKMQNELIEKYFGQKPKVFRLTELIYSDQIGETVAELGYKAMLTEGAKHILGWKSPNYLYCNAINPKLKVLLRNFRLSDDIAFRFSNKGWSEWPLTVDKFLGWIHAFEPKENIVNLFMDYETFGEHQWKETGIFEFMKALPGKAIEQGLQFNTPGEIAATHDPVSAINVPYPISWADEERDLTAWLGNEMQDEAFTKLYSLKNRVELIDDPDIQRDWNYLQTSDHFYYMCTKWFSDGAVHNYFNPYGSPYEAYINYMNALSDFIIRIEKLFPKDFSQDFSNLSPSEIEDKLQAYSIILSELKDQKKNFPVKKTEKAVNTLNKKQPVKRVKPTTIKKENNKANVVKKAEPAKKTTTVKKIGTVKKTTPAKKAEPVKKAAPIKKAAAKPVGKKKIIPTKKTVKAVVKNAPVTVKNAKTAIKKSKPKAVKKQAAKVVKAVKKAIKPIAIKKATTKPVAKAKTPVKALKKVTAKPKSAAVKAPTKSKKKK